MSGWHDGYVVDVPYISSAYGFLGPASLSLVALLSGQPPIGRPFTYVELGCGAGLTSCVVAASCPDATVWACDFNPAHVEQARALAASVGLSNCTFEEVSFADLDGADRPGPEHVDIVVMHGIYSWVTEANRRHLVEFLRRRLVPGGLAFVSYDVMTGWAAILPIREAIARQADTDPRRSDRSVVGALATIRQLAVDGAETFPLPRSEGRLLDDLSGHDAAYVAHEYLNGAFHPLMFAEVADQLAEAKCSYLGSSSFTERSVELRVPPELVTTVASAPDLAMRETLCDLLGGTMFRRDVFRRGRVPPDSAAWRRHLDGLVLLRGDRPASPSLTVPTTAGEASLAADVFEPALERLATGPTSGAELREIPGLRAQTDDAFATSVAMLVSGGYAQPTLGGGGLTRGSAAPAFNRMLVEEARAGRPRGYLVAPAITAIIPLDTLVVLAIGEHWDGTPPQAGALAAATRQRIAARGLSFASGDAGLDDVGLDAAVMAAARHAVELIDSRLDGLGVNAPLRTSSAQTDRGRPRKRS